MKLSSAFWSTAYLFLASLVRSEGELTGYPGNAYDPFCAMSCLRSLSSLTLSCSSMGETVGMVTYMTSSSCWADDEPYLTSLAWCMHDKCAEFDIQTSKLEFFWENQATGQTNAGVKIVPPKWSYGEALMNVSSQPPVAQLTADDTDLKVTSRVAEDVYEMQWNVLTGVQREGTVENGYGIAMLVTGFATPIFFTLLSYVPFVSTFIRRLKPFLVWPSTIRSYSVRPLPYLIGNAPTVGQSLYIVMFIVLNIVLTSVNYESRQPNAWYSSTWREIMAFVLYRTGNFAYIMAPLIFLFASRNNILLWLSNWSHSTFLLLHRWIARVFAVQAILHSILAVVLYKAEGMYDMEASKPYWIWGIVATVLVVVLTFGSGLYIRHFAYEFFLISHIVMSVIVVVGCWYHAYDLYAFLGGYADWIYAISAVWFGDRLVRIVRIVVVGPRRATVTELGEGYVRVDVPGVRWGLEPGKHVYVYFPGLRPWRPWENHPFSVMPSALLGPVSSPSGALNSHTEDGNGHLGEHGEEEKQVDLIEKHEASSSSSDMERQHQIQTQTRTVTRSTSTHQHHSHHHPHHHHHPTIGLTLYIRKSPHRGSTTHLLTPSTNLLTLVEGPYPNNSTRDILRTCDRLLLIGGGIGITALLPFITNHWNVKLAWSVKEAARCLVDDLGGFLDGAVGRGLLETDIRVGKRLDVEELVLAERERGWERVGVVVSGPGGLCDAVREVVIAVGQERSPLDFGSRERRTEWELLVESYSI